MFSLLILGCSLWFYIESESSIGATIFATICFTVVALLFGGFSLGLLISIPILGLLIFGYFSLLDFTHEGSFYWPSLIGGFLLLLFAGVWA